jgi:hypothetical protein
MTEKYSRHSRRGLNRQIIFDTARLRDKIIEHSRPRCGVIRKRRKNFCSIVALQTLNYAKNIFVSRATKIHPVRIAGYPVVFFLVGVCTRRAACVKAFGNTVTRYVNSLDVQLRTRLQRKNKHARAKAQESV